MKRTIADGQHYFGDLGYPITVLRARTTPGHTPSHPHDLTEIEHSHDFCELVIITAGTGLQWLEGDDFPVTAGDVFLLQGRRRHYFHQRNNLEMINIMYDPDKLHLPESELRRIPGYCAMFLLEPASRRQHRFASRLHLRRIALAHVERIAAEMEQEIAKKRPGAGAVLFSRLIDLIVYLSRAYTNATSTEAHALLRVGSVISALESNSSRKWTISELVKTAHMSRSTLMRVFRKATGQTPIEYLIRLRIQRAMELLRQTDFSITEIAMETGFNDSNYFSRQFRKATSISPTTYRRQTGAMG